MNDIMKKNKILVINPGSTSTKIAVYENETEILNETLRHDVDELNQYSSVISQIDFRKNTIFATLSAKKIDLKSFVAVAGRGGLLKPVVSGTYEINDAMLKDLKGGYYGEHASNLGAILAKEIADVQNIPSYIVDPTVVDELDDIARLSGLSEINRYSKFHALNQKAIAKRYAKEHNNKYDELNLIVAHLGGGVSVGAHRKGKVVDVNNALNGDGPFSPERAGGIPSGDLVKFCFNSGLSEKEILKKLSGKGGFVSYLNTNDVRKIAKLANQDNDAKLALDAFAYQVSKSIGECAVVLNGEVDAIILTGGIAHNRDVIFNIADRTEWIAPIKTYPGEDEMLALAQGVLRVLSGEEKVKTYC